MYCPKCGTQNPDNAQSCNSCGAVLTPPSPAGVLGTPPQGVPDGAYGEPIVPKTSGLAITALVLGILSLFTFILTGIPSIICGIISLIKIEKSGGRLTGKGFAIMGIILPVVLIPIIALLMGILMPALARVRQQAKTIMCMSNQRQLGIAWAMYLGDNNDSFMTDENWLEPIHPYIPYSREMLLCPMAEKPEGRGDGTTFTAWQTPGGDIGSYGINGWAINPKSENITSSAPGTFENYWRTSREIRRPGETSLMMDCRQIFARPLATDPPPQVEDTDLLRNTGQMQRVCINRHNGYINTAFMDFSVRKTGLKELWLLKWHRTYDTEGPWTQRGGVDPTDWPDWMRKFRGY